MDKLYYYHFQAAELFTSVGLKLNFKPVAQASMTLAYEHSAEGSLLRQFLYDAAVSTQVDQLIKTKWSGVHFQHSNEWADERSRYTGKVMDINFYRNRTYLRTYLNGGGEYPVSLRPPLLPPQPAGLRNIRGTDDTKTGGNDVDQIASTRN